MRYSIYVLIILCGILPACFKRTVWVRYVSLLLLGGLILIYMVGLQTPARLASSREYQQTKESPSMEWMDGAYKTQRVIEELHLTGLLLFAALMVLAATPGKKKAREVEILPLPKGKKSTADVELGSSIDL